MKFLYWKKWGIKARLILITIFPIAIMFLSMITYSYWARHAEVGEELNDRGQLIALTIASSSEYAIASANFDYLARTIHHLFDTDPSVNAVVLLDAQKHPLLNLKNPKSDAEEIHSFEAPVQKEWAMANTLDQLNEPHLASRNEDSRSSQLRQVIGYIHITLSSSLLLNKYQHRLLWEASLITIALLLSAIFGIFFTLSLTRPLAQTISAIRCIKQGNYDIQFAKIADGELGGLQKAIADMSTSLKAFKNKLEEKVAARTNALERAKDEAIQSNEEKRRLIQKINAVSEAERKTIAIEIHDHLNASLIAARLEAQAICDLTNKNLSQNICEVIKKKAQTIISLSNELYASGRKIVRRLRPEVIDMLGLEGAVNEVVDHFSSTSNKSQFSLHIIGNLSMLDSELSMTAYRLIQEALLNVVKHAQATQTKIRLKLFDKKTLFIYIADNGQGFDYQANALGIGLIGMRERVHSLSGEIRIRTQKSKGTKIIMALPL